MYSTSEKGLALLKKFEGFSPKAYLCAAGVPTIGFGNTTYLDGRKVKLGDRLGTDNVSAMQEATALLLAILPKYEKAVNGALSGLISQNQFDALVSFTYNVGVGAFQKSTLLKLIKANPNDLNIRAQFLRWNKAGGKELRGLTLRRTEEANLYFSK
jgi:lysozyme